MENINNFIEALENSRLLIVAKAAMFLLIGYLLGKVVSTATAKVLDKRISAHSLVLWRRGLFYSIFGLSAVSALRQLGFDLGVLIGAAGILTVAIGFASQTSASNLISGIFLMIERSFSIGDVIRVGEYTGEVISIDSLSVKLRTFDNLFVRIPNETMIKKEVTTLTKFAIRRADLILRIAYREDISRVKDLLTDLARKIPICLEEPAPLFFINGFGNSGIDLQFSVWAQRENFFELKNRMLEAIKERFQQEDIEIPVPHVSVYAGSETGAIPIKLVDAKLSSDTELPATDKSA